MPPLYHLGNIKEKPEKRAVAPASFPDNEIIAVTGMHRSGTSCLMGLLNRCGYSLGTTHRLLEDNNPQSDNPKGHYENMGVLNINKRIIRGAGGAWLNLPRSDAIRNSGISFQKDIIRFSQTFDGHIIKDPRLCLTLNLWREYCPNLKYILICLRNPLSVARSLENRDKMPFRKGIALWYEYNRRLIQNLGSQPAIVFDYDRLPIHIEEEFFGILQRIHSPLTKDEMKQNIRDFYERKFNHARFDEKALGNLPKPVIRLYKKLSRM